MSIFEEIHPSSLFGSWESYEKLLIVLKELEERKVVSEIAPSSDMGSSFDERWFVENGSGVVFRLLAPEFPDVGDWSEVKFPIKNNLVT